MIIKRICCYFIPVILLLSLSQCKDAPFQSDNIKEGYIEYDIEYLDDSIDVFIENFLPEKMKIIFDDHNTQNQLKCMGGVFNLTNIKQYEEGTNITLVDFIDKKYKYTEKNDEASLFFRQPEDIIIQDTDSTKEISGITCKEAKVTIPSDNPKNKEQFFIYYTDKIDIKGFNNQTPFESIDGVLLEFQLDFYDIPMKFTAKKIKQTDIPPEEFEIPEEYKKINKKTMKEIIELLK
ncbi:MAG: hypothetical protein ACQESJ_08060 [Bacteroidota bacterium]